MKRGVTTNTAVRENEHHEEQLVSQEKGVRKGFSAGLGFVLGDCSKVQGSGTLH